MTRLGRVVLAGVVVGVALLAGSAVWADEGGVPAEPVQAKPVGKGLKLWVFVHYGKGDNGKGGPPGGSTVNCSDMNSESGYASPFAFAEPLAFQVNEASVPSGLGPVTPVLAGATNSSSNTVAGLLTFQSGGTATGPAQDGVDAIGWANLVPRRVLAATWTWTDASNHVVEADIFYNRSQPWATFASCPEKATGSFDVADIGVHELGHALGLNHFSDGQKQSTMYPSAPPDEVRKTSLTAGDVAAFQASLAG